MKSYLIAALVGAFLLVHLTDGTTFIPGMEDQYSYNLVHFRSVDVVEKDLDRFWKDEVLGPMMTRLKTVLMMQGTSNYDIETLDNMLWRVKSRGVLFFLDTMKDLYHELDRLEQPPVTYPAGGSVPPEFFNNEGWFY